MRSFQKRTTKERSKKKMINQQNLIPISTHERAVELGRRGGLVKSPKKTWTNLKYCAQKCPYSGGCPFMSASMASPDGLCALKKKKVVMGGRDVAIQPEVIESFFSIFEDGKEGLLREALAALYKIRLRSANASVPDLHEYIGTILDIVKTMYPTKTEAMDTNININFQNPEWISKVEAERKIKEQRKKTEIIETTAVVLSDIPQTN